MKEILKNNGLTRNEVFISYSHKDGNWLTMLQKHLKPYIRNREISVWDDTQIRTGEEWESAISCSLACAKVGVLLVSPNFLASDFIAKDELPPILEAAERKGLTIVWVPVSASSYKVTEIAKYQSAHNPKKPLDSLDQAQQNEALVAVCEKIAQAYIE